MIEREAKIQSEEEECEDSWIRKWRCAALKTIVQRVVDDDRLTDVYWRSEMREVELWENERYVGESLFSPSCIHCLVGPTSSEPGPMSRSLEPSLSRSSFASLTSLGSSPQRIRISRGKGSWSKANLKPSERGPWTRRRDGWNRSGGYVSFLMFEWVMTELVVAAVLHFHFRRGGRLSQRRIGERTLSQSGH
jgi:hypothetical protein